MAELEVGSKALDFTLPSTVGDRVCLGDYLGRDNIVLAFYFHDFTGVCTNEMCLFSNEFAEFENLKARVFGISVDSIFSHRAFAEKNKIRIPLLSDFNKEVSRAYGVLRDLGAEKGVSMRSVFIIDKEGTIRYRWVADRPVEEPDYDEIKRMLGQLQ